MQLINEVLHDKYKVILVYLDNILIYTETLEEHMKLVKKLCATQLYTNLSKCKFHKEKTIWATAFPMRGLR